MIFQVVEHTLDQFTMRFTFTTNFVNREEYTSLLMIVNSKVRLRFIRIDRSVWPHYSVVFICTSGNAVYFFIAKRCTVGLFNIDSILFQTFFRNVWFWRRHVSFDQSRKSSNRAQSENDCSDNVHGAWSISYEHVRTHFDRTSSFSTC
uniref:Odorant-binding protein 25 n=1 Tax=Chouioia cunea TaxID=1570515 RepID=A0A6B9CJM4_9HYME|nr:odorant-binding protein 25 [Chouioia cunea]